MPTEVRARGLARSARTGPVVLTLAGFGGLALGALGARRPGVSVLERRVFSSVNALPPGWHVPVWAVMQLGSLGGVAVTAGVAARAGEPGLARRVAVWGTVTWAGAKVVKRVVRRGRPRGVLDAARVLGREQAGLGYPSGHAAVAASLGALVAPALPGRWRSAAWVAALAVGPARMFVGAHLPLDVAGGIAFGVGMSGVVRLVDDS